tara:strand:+ start:182 stop:643 length:462 start_codon:yes stop_codon:yes gene_type:complete
MDKIDKKILESLQTNVTLPLSEVAKNVGISTTPCWSRIKKLEKEKVIISKTIHIDNEKINLPITVFLMISIQNHTDEWLKNFVSVVNKYDQIIEVHRLTGSKVDYQLKILTNSIHDYDNFQQKLIKEIECTNMISSVSLQTIKKFKKLPLDQI